MAIELSKLQYAESGGLAFDQLMLLHETSKEVLQSEMLAAEESAHTAQQRYTATASRLRKREDDLVLLIQSYETLKDAHSDLTQRVQGAADGSAVHAARLQGEMERLRAAAATKNDDIAKLLQREGELSQQLAMREQQLALCVTHLEAGKTETDVLKTRGSVEENRLRHVLAEREEELVKLVRGLYELATAERVPGIVAHEARSRVFRRCAIVYEQLGEAAFRSEVGGEGADEDEVEAPREELSTLGSV